MGDENVSELDGRADGGRETEWKISEIDILTEGNIMG